MILLAGAFAVAFWTMFVVGAVCLVGTMVADVVSRWRQ